MNQDSSFDAGKESMISATQIFPLSIDEQLQEYVGKDVLFSLKASQLSILNQTFRPLMVGRVDAVESDYVFISNVNIKMQNAPEFVFKTPLIIPMNMIAWFMEFDRSVRFSIY